MKYFVQVYVCTWFGVRFASMLTPLESGQVLSAYNEEGYFQTEKNKLITVPR